MREWRIRARNLIYHTYIRLNLSISLLYVSVCLCLPVSQTCTHTHIFGRDTNINIKKKTQKPFLYLECFHSSFSLPSLGKFFSIIFIMVSTSTNLVIWKTINSLLWSLITFWWSNCDVIEDVLMHQCCYFLLFLKATDV